jgi:NDP-sugar pyrophosphorylase family protein
VKAIVLAAGLGERLRPLTLVRAKPVIPVLNRPLLHWTLERLARQGVTDVVVNLHHLRHTVHRALGDGSAFGLRIRYSFERTILGTAGGPRHVRRFFGKEPFLIVNGDVLFDFDVRPLVREHRRSRAQATLAVRRNPDPRRYGGVVADRRGWIQAIAGKPAHVRGGPWLFTGVHVMEPALLDRLREGPSDSVRDLYIPMLGEGARLRAVRTEGTWYDFGDPSLYLRSHASLLASGMRGFRSRRRLVHATAIVARTARIERSVVGAGCVIGPGARVSGSVLWDRVAVREGARVEDSIAASRVTIEAGEHEKDVILVPRPDGLLRTWMR